MWIIDQSIYSLQIPLVMDLPVGKNLQDHMMFPAMIHVNESISGSDWVYGFWSQLKYSLFRSGWYTIKHNMNVMLLFNKIFFIRLFYKNVALGLNFSFFYYILINNGHVFKLSFNAFLSIISLNGCLYDMWNQFRTIEKGIYCPICFLLRTSVVRGHARSCCLLPDGKISLRHLAWCTVPATQHRYQIREAILLLGFLKTEGCE